MIHYLWKISGAKAQKSDAVLRENFCRGNLVSDRAMTGGNRMKIRTRLAIAFVTITVVPIVLIFVAAFGLVNYQEHLFQKTYGLSEQIDLLSGNQTQVFNRLTQGIQEEIREAVGENTDLFEEEVQEKLRHGDHPLEFPGLQFTRTPDESKALNETYYPSIIISASGMCDIGRIKHHLKHNLWNPSSTILFVGYQAPGTLGRSIVDGADKVKIFGEEISVNARIEYIEGYSGHADQEWLLNFVYSFIKKPKHIFLVHGEEESEEVLKGLIEKNTEIPVTIPSFGEKYEVADIPKLEERVEYSKKLEDQYLRLQILEKLDKIKDDINTMTQNVKNEKLMKENSDEEIEKYVTKFLEIFDKLENTDIKEKCREKVVNGFSISKMINTMDKEFTRLIKSGSKIDKNLLKNVELAERYLLVHGVLESKDEREKR